MADKFKAMVSLRTPIGPGNGMPLKGKSPAAMFKQSGVKTIPAKKTK